MTNITAMWVTEGIYKKDINFNFKVNLRFAVKLYTIHLALLF